MDLIYQKILLEEQKTGVKVDLLLCCGDFEAIRNEEDLKAKVCPSRYKHMRDFHKYYSGEKEAPVLTIFVGKFFFF